MSGSGGSSVYEVADKANKAVGRGLAGAIEKGEEATEATKETLGTISHCRNTQDMGLTRVA